jgi:hypothetical protein
LKSLWKVLFPLLIVFVGCGSDTSDVFTQTGDGSGTQNTLTIVHEGGLARNADHEFDVPGTIPEGVDSLGVTLFSENGTRIGYHEVVAAREVSIAGIPRQTQSVDIDYLRNGGYAVAEDSETVVWNGNQARVEDPDPGPATEPSSHWTTSVDPDGRAHLKVGVEGNAPEEFLVKGVAYSPAPIGYNTRQSLDLGDFFWDTPAPQFFIDWEGLWQRDLENIRKLGFNTIRVYNMSPYHLNAVNPGDPPIKGIPDPDNIPDEDNGVFLYEHTKFLDACWNNGEDPIYVLVGVSMPAEIWVKGIHDSGQSDAFVARVIKFWDRSFPIMVDEVKTHPAVMGFTVFNEQAFPHLYSDNAADPAVSTFWWDQVKKYTELGKGIAPTKLMGWATNDDPQIPIAAPNFLASHGQALDFFGVNGYQTDNWNPTLDNYRVSQLGDLARPVILTEFGMPVTTRTDKTLFQPFLGQALAACQQLLASQFGVAPNQVQIPPGTDVNLTFPTLASAKSIVNDDPAVLARAAEIVGSLSKKSFEHPICVGMTYFDWCDEWWKQEPYGTFLIPDFASADPNAKKTVHCVPLEPFTQEGGQPQVSFPGGYWDEEGFGLHSIALNPKRTAAQVFADKQWKTGANTVPDDLTPRQPVLDALLNSYGNAESTRDGALAP